MKIYKNKLISLLEEADKTLPIYLMITSHRKEMFVEKRVNVTAFTPARTVLHLPCTTYNGFVHPDEEKKAREKNKEVYDDMVKIIEAQGFMHKEGLIHDQDIPCNNY